MTIAMSTDGEAPALAGLMREALEVLLPEDLDTWMARAQEARRELARAGRADGRAAAVAARGAERALRAEASREHEPRAASSETSGHRAAAHDQTARRSRFRLARRRRARRSRSAHAEGSRSARRCRPGALRRARRSGDARAGADRAADLRRQARRPPAGPAGVHPPADDSRRARRQESRAAQGRRSLRLRPRRRRRAGARGRRHFIRGRAGRELGDRGRRARRHPGDSPRRGLRLRRRLGPRRGRLSSDSRKPRAAQRDRRRDDGPGTDRAHRRAAHRARLERADAGGGHKLERPPLRRDVWTMSLRDLRGSACGPSAARSRRARASGRGPGEH